MDEEIDLESREEVLATIARLEEAGNIMGLNELAGLLKLARKFELEKLCRSVIEAYMKSRNFKA